MGKAPAYKIFNRIGWVEWPVYWQDYHVLLMAYTPYGGVVYYTCYVYSEYAELVLPMLVKPNDVLEIDCNDSRFYEYLGISA